MPFCLMLLDMDHFKEVNDEHGHQSGDEVLKTLTDYLKNSFRVTDLIARYGGEEFTILLQDIDIEEGRKIAERIKDEIAQIEFKIPAQEESLKKTASIGIAEFNMGESSAELIERADKALYEAKEAGRNKVVVA